MSKYLSFEVYADNDDGTVTPVANQTVKVYDVTNAALLADTATDSTGTVPGASVAVAVGTRLRFSALCADGRKRCAEQLTV